MKATATIDASSLSEARKQADEAFREFFGGRDYGVLSESAESDLVVGSMSGEQPVVSWRCEFVAEESQ